MNNAIAVHKEPWFRQFWPWFIMSIPAMTVCACGYTIWLAFSSSDSLVVEKGRGVDVQTDAFIAAESNARLAGITGLIEIDIQTGAVILTLENAPESIDTLGLRFSHPTLAQYDFSLSVSALPEPGRYTAFLPRRIEGRWYVSLQDKAKWRVSGILNDANKVRLNSQGTGR